MTVKDRITVKEFAHLLAGVDPMTLKESIPWERTSLHDFVAEWESVIEKKVEIVGEDRTVIREDFGPIEDWRNYVPKYKEEIVRVERFSLCGECSSLEFQQEQDRLIFNKPLVFLTESTISLQKSCAVGYADFTKDAWRKFCQSLGIAFPLDGGCEVNVQPALKEESREDFNSSKESILDGAGAENPMVRALVVALKKKEELERTGLGEGAIRDAVEREIREEFCRLNYRTNLRAGKGEDGVSQSNVNRVMAFAFPSTRVLK